MGSFSGNPNRRHARCSDCVVDVPFVDRSAIATAIVACCLVMLMSPESSHAMGSRGGDTPIRAAGLWTVLKAGGLDISVIQVSTTTCTTLIQGDHSRRTRPGWEWLYVDWQVRNRGDHRFAFPDSNHPGYRMVVGARLYPGVYGGYPGYGAVIDPHTTINMTWTFAIRRGTRYVKLTYVPPGPQRVLWLVVVPRISSPVGQCPLSP